MLPKKYQKRVIDPLSLFAIGFLVISLIVGTKIVTDRQRSLDIRNEAKEIADCTYNECGSGYKCIGGSCELIPAPLTKTNCVADGGCTGPGDSCCSGNNYFDTACPVTETKCGTKSSPSTPTPGPTLPTPTPGPTLKDIGYFCTSNNECASGYCTYSPGGDKWCQDKPAADPIPYCSTQMARICSYGCSPSTYGGSCKSAPVVAEEKTTLKTNGEICTTSNDCQSGKCQYASFGLSKCIAVRTEEEQKQQKEDTLIATGQFLNTITFGAFGDYVSTYADINAQQPESTYLEKSFSQEGLESSAKLGAIITAEGAALYFGGAALGGTSLLEIPISTTFGLPSITQSVLYGSLTAQSALASAPQWVTGALKTTGVVLGNIGVYQGSKACQADPGSLECSMLIAGIQMGWMDDLAKETGTFLEDAYEATTYMAAQSLEDAQVLYSVDPNMRRLMNLGDDSALDVATDLSLSSVDDAYIPPTSPSKKVPSTVTLESGEVIAIGEQIGSSGKQGSAYLGQTCTGESCVVKLFDLENIPDGFSEEALSRINTAQLDIMSTYGTAENTFLPQYYGSVVDDSGQAVGYAMQQIEGQTLQGTIQAQGGLTSQQITAVDEAIREFQTTTNMPHGDLLNPWYEEINTRNIMMTPEGGAILIDPAGASFQESAFYSTQDLMQIESLDILRKLQEVMIE